MLFEDQIDLVQRRIAEEAREPTLTFRVFLHCVCNTDRFNTVKPDRLAIARHLGADPTSTSRALALLTRMRVLTRRRVSGKMEFRVNHNIASHLPEDDGRRRAAQELDGRIEPRPAGAPARRGPSAAEQRAAA